MFGLFRRYLPRVLVGILGFLGIFGISWAASNLLVEMQEDPIVQFKAGLKKSGLLEAMSTSTPQAAPEATSLATSSVPSLKKAVTGSASATPAVRPALPLPVVEKVLPKVTETVTEAKDLAEKIEDTSEAVTKKKEEMENILKEVREGLDLKEIKDVPLAPIL
ncbi:MAG TPA: hypothetical protein VGB97_02270 [Candidatus Paceibacterota bacterium]